MFILEIPKHFKMTQEKSRQSKNAAAGNTLFWEIPNVRKSIVFNLLKKAGTDTSRRSVFFWESWIWDQCLPENMRWKCGNMGSISPRKINGFWNFETLNETLKLWKIWNLETLRIWYLETSKLVYFHPLGLRLARPGSPSYRQVVPPTSGTNPLVNILRSTLRMVRSEHIKIAVWFSNILSYTKIYSTCGKHGKSKETYWISHSHVWAIFMVNLWQRYGCELQLLD